MLGEDHRSVRGSGGSIRSRIRRAYPPPPGRRGVAQGVPSAREYGGLLANRSFGGAQVSRTFYCRGQTGQQLLLGAYQALSRQVGEGRSALPPQAEMLGRIVDGGRAQGIVVRDLRTGALRSHTGDAVILATGGYSNV